MEREGAGLCPLCTCAIPAQEFEYVRYRFALDRGVLQNWTEIWSITAEAYNLDVKPLPLVNLTVVNKGHLFLLNWQMDPRANDVYMTKMSYEVAYWVKGQEEKLDKCPEDSCPGSCPTLDRKPHCFPVKGAFSEITSDYEIYPHQLTPNSDYMASVRFRLDHWGNIWSEWSSPCTWHNGFEHRDQHWKSIPWLCVPVVAMIVVCHVCLGRVKKWQGSIPRPVIVIGKKISSPIISEIEKRPSLHGVKALLCDLCNRSCGRTSPDRNHPKAFSGQRVEWMVSRGGENNDLPHALVLHPEAPLIECCPIQCIQETGPEMALEETNCPPEAPHADAQMASLFQDAIRAGDTWASPELSLAGQGAPFGGPWVAPDSPSHAPCLNPEGSPWRETMEGSSESSHLSSNLSSGASLQATSPVLHLGPTWGTSIPEEAHGSLRDPAGGFDLQRTFCGRGGPVLSLPHTDSGYKSLGSLSQPPATFDQAWEEQEKPLRLLPGGQRIHFPLLDVDGNSNTGHPLSPGLSGQQLPFPGGQDLFENSLVTGPAPPALDPSPKYPLSQTTPGYQSFSLLISKGTETQEGLSGMVSHSDPDIPYKPLLSVLRSGDTKPPLASNAVGKEQ